MNYDLRRSTITRARDAVRQHLEGRAPELAIVLGSGLGHLAGRVTDAVHISYDRIPGFPLPTVKGHAGELVAGALAGRLVIMQSGRFHMYEGHSADISALPVRVFAELGVRTLIVTNAAGGVRRSFSPGTLMLIADHLNLTGRNALIGEALPNEERFPDMSEAYDAGLRRLARQVAQERGIPLEEGIYAGLLGPNYETPAEVRMVGALGADAVGMSTVIEVIAARARGVRCLGISTVTNAAAGISEQPLSHSEVMEAADKVKDHLGALVEGVASGTA
ncbi:MAG TPA: purine-nucleoside phosphorylase [Gemmatimonadales bacterium]|jgi:purine-nucleoside phosphorylase|nr:purine-nucleoside phosphorylase [Gemmatimonadales bacterium]